MRLQSRDLQLKIQRLQGESRVWAERVRDEHMFVESDIEAITKAHKYSPSELFGNKTERPLVVAFFGGTGVGKSSLLNRFAQQEVARVGIERPTSREVTLYLHKEFEVKKLPKDFPTHRVNIRQHKDKGKQDILWIDMPDIDSVESENLQSVKDWIPYIDVLVYVVSPERYRDDRGWRFLVEYGYRHGWLFVINQWDLAVQNQSGLIDDFKAVLVEAGFNSPMIFHTDCLNTTDGDPDDFDRLQETLSVISDDHILMELERRGLRVWVRSLQKGVEQLLEKLGKPEVFEELKAYQGELYKNITTELRIHLELPIRRVVAQHEVSSPQFSLVKILLNRESDKSSDESESKNSRAVEDSVDLWDTWAEKKLQAALDKLVWKADQLQLPARAIKKRLQRMHAISSQRIISRFNQALQQGLIYPGNRVQRFAYSTFGFLNTVLPICALIWVAYRIVTGFSGTDGGEYLGINFAVHSLMLVLVSWFIPYFIQKKCRPSISRSIKKALDHTFIEVMAEIDTEVNEAMKQVELTHKNLHNRGLELIKECQLRTPADSHLDQNTLARMLQKQLQAEDSLPKIVNTKIGAASGTVPSGSYPGS